MMTPVLNRILQYQDSLLTGYNTTIMHKQQCGSGGGQQFSVFDVLNQRLIGYGFPRFIISQHTVKHIVFVGFILARLLFG